MGKMTEAQEHKQVVDYIKAQYSRLLFNTDMSGIKLSIGAAKKAALLRSRGDKFPDLVIYQPNYCYHGLFIELKKTGESVYNKHGEYKNDHIKAQANTLKKLRNLGYKAVFAIGFDQAKIIIDNYMKI